MQERRPSTPFFHSFSFRPKEVRSLGLDLRTSLSLCLFNLRENGRGTKNVCLSLLHNNTSSTIPLPPLSHWPARAASRNGGGVNV